MVGDRETWSWPSTAIRYSLHCVREREKAKDTLSNERERQRETEREREREKKRERERKIQPLNRNHSPAPELSTVQIYALYGWCVFLDWPSATRFEASIF